MTDEAEDATTGGAGAAGSAEPAAAAEEPAAAEPDPTAESPEQAPGPDALHRSGAIKVDDIADLFNDYPAGIAAFKAFVGQSYTYDTYPDRPMRRLYTDDTGWEWVEVVSDDIVAQMPVGLNPTDPRSLVFLRSQALVTMCRVDYASQVKDQAFGVDPRGGPNAPRRPPY